MSGIEEDSFDFPEFLEKENCLPASNSSTTSSIFEVFFKFLYRSKNLHSYSDSEQCSFASKHFSATSWENT